MKFLLHSFALIIVFNLGVMADACPPSTLRVSGEGRTTVKPDRAIIHIGVVSEAESAKAAARANAKKMADIIDGIGDAAEIKTISYSINPQYRYPREGGEPILTGYSVNNTLSVTIDNLDIVGAIIDTATSSGANTVQSLQFVLKDEAGAKLDSLRAAALDAKKKAWALAGALDAQITGILSIDESGMGSYPPPMPMQKFAMAEQSAAPTQIEAGTMEVVTMVNVTFEIR